MNISDNGIKFIGNFEGLYRYGKSPKYAPKTAQLHLEDPSKIYTYIDPIKLPTIGYGHLITSTELINNKIVINGEVCVLTQGLTIKQVNDLKRQDLVRFVNAVNTNVKVNLTQNMFDALVSWAFNVGVGAVSNSGSTLIRVLNQKNYIAASNEFVKWNRAGGKVLKGLTNRRLAEKALFLKNI